MFAHRNRRRCILVAMTGLLATVALRAQGPPAPPPPAGQGNTAQGRGQAPPPPRLDYPPRTIDTAAAERGKAIYSVNCAFCHGADARGGDGGGPNLLRSQLVLSDQRGELIGPVILSGRPGTAMPPLALTAQQIADVADFLHSFRVGGYDVSRMTPVSIVVGDAKAGAVAFQTRCGACHSATGDLKDVASRYPDPRQMQDAWLMPTTAGRAGGGGRRLTPVTVTVTLPSGQRIEGPLVRIDDYVVALQLPDGTPRSFGRRDQTPVVTITDPLKPHRDLLATYTDAEIHNITAYLVTLK